MTFTYLGRLIFWNFADLDDYKKFPSALIRKSETPFRFIKSQNQAAIQLPGKSKLSNSYENFEQFLEETKSVVFLVIKDDTIIYEKYFDGFSEHSVIPSFSISKSLVSALIGIAIGENIIKDVNQPITSYVTGFKNPGFENITIEHLLDMRSGIEFKETYSGAFNTTTRFYYGKNLKDYVYKLKIKEEPGKRYDYISCNVQILAMALEKASGKSLPRYFEEKIWSQIGTEYDASWSLDCKKNQTAKAFCCLNACPHDFAKFGRLYLHKGKWNGEQVVPESFVNRTLTIHNDSKDDAGYPYSYQFRVLENGSFFAKGIMGQYLHVIPSKSLIFLRMGHSSGGIDWPMVFEEVGEGI